MTLPRAISITGALVVALLLATAAPAGAHGLGGLTPTNYETQLQRVSPHVPGLTIEVVDLGTQVQLTNRTAHDIVVLGYDGEPYLRVGPGDTARWHDHRAHFMGNDDPPAVARDPGQRRVVDNFEIPMRTNGTAVIARGQIIYVPPPSPWPWVIGAVILAAIVFALARTSSWRTVFAVTLALLTVIEVIHVVGLWGASTAAVGTKFVESAYSLGGILLGILGLAWMWRKGVEAAIPLVLVATIFLFVAGGLADVATLGHSQVPSTFSAALARLLVTITLGLGAGLGLAAAFRLRPPPLEPAPVTS